MAKLPYMPFYPSDYLRDTRCLSLSARGVWIDLICALWNAPTRGKKTLTIEGWAGEVGKGVTEILPYFSELETQKVFTCSRKANGDVTLTSRRMVREEKAREQGRKRVERYRRNANATRHVTACNGDVTADISEIIYQKSEVISGEELIKKEKKKKKEKKEIKSCGGAKTPPPPAKSSAAWDSYLKAFEQRYGIPPKRNAKVNAQLGQLVDRLGAQDAVDVARFYLSHNDPFYVRKRHPVGLLLQDAEGLHTQWATGIKATTSEAKNLEFKDNVVGQAERIIANMAKREAAHEQ